MAYSQKFGLSRNSPLLNVEDEKNNPVASTVDENNNPVTSTVEKNNNPATSIVEKNNAKAIFDKFPPNTGSNPHMLSQGTEDDSWWQKFKTAISNPLDAFKVAGGFGQDQFKGEGHTYRSMTSLRNAKDAQAKGVKVPDLEKGNTMNNVLSLAPPMMLAQTISDAASGDLTALATKKLNKIPGIKKYVNAKNAKKLYYGMKGFKGLAKGL